ncbi:MAG: transglycosylase SLT domain-containing protein, partial [Flavobacteriaceae bacterium]|nr:transglycosylase SLT domain-containing protein [Flavobacteriaceae bacterium]
PTAKSRVGASGLWQFMYQTGRLYDLEVSSYVDERFDPIKATEAACKYMLDLYSVYQDWNLVLAAYNAGPGNVNKAIRRSGGYTNYWNIRPYLPRETAEYVPRFLAIMYLYNYAEKHGFKPNRNQYLHFETDTVQVKQLMKFEHLEKKIGIDIDVVKFLNPEYKLDIVPAPKDKTYSIRLPIEYAGLLVSNEAEIYAWIKEEIEQAEKPLPENVKWNERVVYRVRKGDFLGKIANLHKVSVGQIKRWNNLRSDRLSIGQRLVIYPRR